MTIPHHPQRQRRLAILATTIVLLAGKRERGAPGAANGQANDDLRAALEADEDGQTGEALALIRQARQKDPKDYDLALHEAVFLWKLDRLDDAIVVFMEAASLAPPTVGAAHYWAAVHLTRRKDPTAIDYLAEALQREPSLLDEVHQDELFERWRDDLKYQDAIELAFYRALTDDEHAGN